MSSTPATVLQAIRERLVADGFVFAPRPQVCAALPGIGDTPEWDAFSRSWEDLAFDHSLADHFVATFVLRCC